MKKQKQEAFLKELAGALEPRLREMVLAIMEEKLRADPHAFDGITEASRQSFLKRSVTK
jgi:hypothetical protein